METSTSISEKYIKLFLSENPTKRGDAIVNQFLSKYKKLIWQEILDITPGSKNANDHPEDIKPEIAIQSIEDQIRRRFGDQYPGFSY